MQTIPLTPERYRSLILTTLYIEARKRGCEGAKLPPDLLSSLGVSIQTRRVGAFESRTFAVAIPEDLDSQEARDAAREMERMLARDGKLLGPERRADGREGRMAAVLKEDWKGLEPLEELPEHACGADAIPKDTF